MNNANYVTDSFYNQRSISQLIITTIFYEEMRENECLVLYQISYGFYYMDGVWCFGNVVNWTCV